MFLALTVITLAALVWLWNYEPLAYGNAFGAEEATEVRTIMLGSEYQFEHEPGGTFAIQVQVRNNSPLTVTILDVVRERYYYWRLSEVGIDVISPRSGGGMTNEYRAFRPVRLRSGEEVNLRLGYEFADCNTEGGSSSGLESFSVRFKVAGFERESKIMLPDPIAITNLGGQCDDLEFQTGR